MPIGGAYSIDKYYRIRNGLPGFETEQPDEAIKKYVEQKLDKVNWQLDIVLSHTVPIECEPVWAFIPGLDQSTVDKSTENGFNIFITIWNLQSGMQDIIMWNVKKVESGLCLKSMMRLCRAK